MLVKALLPLWIITAILLFLYSFTQVDLSLTLSQASILQQIQKSFQYIGWFNRSLSTYLYVGLIIWMFSLFVLTLRLAVREKITSKKMWTIIICLAVILIPSYNAFSYDLFNYIFDARIVTNYHVSPYEFKPLDFPTDAMLSFMRSTHRVYPYGPTWLGLTVPLTFAANEVFAISLLLFKTLSAAAFIGTAFFIKKIAEKLKLQNVNLAVIIFALNPLVIIESLVSSHNEIVMMFFMVASIYMLFRNKKITSILFLIISIGIKYATAIFAPLFLLRFFSKISDKRILELAVFLSIFAVIITSLASGQNKNPEFQPWYLLLAAPFISLYEKRIIRVFYVTICFFALGSYIPFLYNGQWPENIVDLKNILLIVGLVSGFLVYFMESRFISKFRG